MSTCIVLHIGIFISGWVTELTAEIGIERLNDSIPLMLQDYGRLNDFLNDWEAQNVAPSALPSDSSPRTPSLVAFVGQTGAGKSSLVKLMIDFATNDRRTNYSTPVVGSRTAHLPTSEDVHLYLDPSTDRKSTRLNSSHRLLSRMPSSA